MAKFKTPWSVKDLIRRSTKSRGLWQLWRSLHQEAYDFAMPERETFRFRSPGQRKNRHIYDSTAVDGLEIYANKVHGGFFPDWLQWMALKAGEDIPKDQRDKINSQLEEVTNRFFGFFHQSNFSTEITPSLKDWGVGTGCIEIEEGRFDKDEPLFSFCNVPLAEIYPERPAKGPVQNSWREYKIEAVNIKETWPDADIPKALQNTIDNKPLDKVEILNGHLADPKDDTFWTVVVYPTTKTILFAQQYATKRRIIFRASVTPGETFGRGPIIRKLPDIRTANKVKQFILENAALQMAGVYTGVDDGIFNPHTVRIAPGSIIPVGSNDTRNPTLTALTRSGDIGLGGLVLDDLQDSINRSLLASPIGDISDPVRSATENVIRMQEDLKRQGSAFGRLYSELIVPMVRACIDIGVSRGQMPEIRVDGREVKIKMVSPLAKQKELEDFQNSQIWYSNVSQLDRSVAMGSVKEEDLPGYWADKLSVPSDLLRSDDEREKIGQAVMAFAQAQLAGGGAQVEPGA